MSVNKPPVHKDKPFLVVIAAVGTVLSSLFTGTDIDQDMLGRAIDTAMALLRDNPAMTIFGVVAGYLYYRQTSPAEGQTREEHAEEVAKKVIEILKQEKNEDKNPDVPKA